jgi:hypothetical protein
MLFLLATRSNIESFYIALNKAYS